jgi:hypothetical protein
VKGSCGQRIRIGYQFGPQGTAGYGGEAECMLAAQRDELGMIEGEVFCEITESPARRR